MDIAPLEAAILAKDPDAVVDAMSGWTESQREEAWQPFNLFVLALGFKYHVLGDCEWDRNHPYVVAKRERDGIAEMSDDMSDRYDYDMYYVAWLARFGLAGQEHWRNYGQPPEHRPQAARLLAQRNPPWFREWYDAVTTGESLEITPDFWALLYEQGMAPADSIDRLAKALVIGLPETMKEQPEAMKKAIREIEASREPIYDVPKDRMGLFYAAGWTPVFEWLFSEDLLDRSRFLECVLDAFHEPLNQTERNGIIAFAKAANTDVKLLAEHQARWAGLVGDAQASVAGFAVEQLAKIHKAGLLDVEAVTAALPGIFSHKPKNHAKKAVDLLDQIAAEPASRRQAVEAVAAGLMHTSKDIQKAALDVLSRHLQPDDTAALETIRLHQASVAATLASEVERLLALAETTSGETPASADTPTTEDTAGDEYLDQATERFKEATEQIPSELRARLRIDEALDAAARAEVDFSIAWTIRDMKVLASAEPIRPIETVDELIEVASAAVERCECADTVDRIVAGITRLYRERPESFATMSRSLGRRACADSFNRPLRGIVGGCLGDSFSLLIRAWLDVKPEEEDDDEDDDLWGFLPTDPAAPFLLELADRVREGTAVALLCEATHAGGWIDPRVWVRRLIETEAAGVEPFEGDLVRSLLRLAPDRRNEALAACNSLGPRFKAMAVAAMGGDVRIDGSWTPQVWITALRARDPWIDLSQHLAPEEQAALTGELKRLPDVIFPSDYQWRAVDLTKTAASGALIESRPTRQEELTSKPPLQGMLDTLLRAIGGDEDANAEIMASAAGSAASARGDYLTATLHYGSVGSSPAFGYPYLASHWPMKLDWYWCAATKAISQRIESGASADDPHGAFFIPLLQLDRPLTEMAARALWIATVSKDPNSRSMAIDVWIALVETDRIDAAMLVSTYRAVAAGGWVKPNRVAEALADVAAASPLHAWAVSEVLADILATMKTLPRGIAPVVELLDECNERLGLPALAAVQPVLQQIKSGKAKTPAKSILARPNSPTPDRRAAVAAALETRMARGTRASG
ncbi:MAG: hypothetical protein JW818_05340 [Pirellulales bacterium]|nr:hypothetical protein [Pirellulales bacterium]